jgi:hypothetical protein
VSTRQPIVRIRPAVGARFVTAVVIASTASACGGSDRSPGPTPFHSPQDYGHCGRASDPGNPDGGFIAGIMRPAGEFASGATATTYACVGHSHGAQVEFLVRGSASVSPRSVPYDSSPNGVFKIGVTATRAGTTQIILRVRSGSDISAEGGCTVVSDGRHWHFIAD